jgi:hypothetical protein
MHQPLGTGERRERLSILTRGVRLRCNLSKSSHSIGRGKELRKRRRMSRGRMLGVVACKAELMEEIGGSEMMAESETESMLRRQRERQRRSLMGEWRRPGENWECPKRSV